MRWTFKPIADKEFLDKHPHAVGDMELITEIMNRAPDLSPDDLKTCFIELRMQFGEDALYAMRSGHVKFEKLDG